MTTKRLTKDMRETLVEEGALFVVGDQRTELRKAGTSILLAARERIYPNHSGAFIDALPDSFTGRSKEVEVTIRREHGSNLTIRVKSQDDVKFAADHCRFTDPKLVLHEDLPADADLIGAVQAYEATEKKLRVVERDFKAAAKARLEKITTVKALLQNWPAAKAFMPAEFLTPVVKEYLPASTIKTLDSMIASAAKRRDQGAVHTEA